jgi:hypothetical protein
MKAATALMPVTAAKQDMILLDEELFGHLSHDLDRPLRVLLTKPFQFATPLSYSPPLGLLYLASALRHRFGDTTEVELLDMKVRHMEPEKVRGKLRDFQPDVIGVSALNCEAAASYELARICKEENEQVITVLGGAFCAAPGRYYLRRERVRLDFFRQFRTHFHRSNIEAIPRTGTGG